MDGSELEVSSAVNVIIEHVKSLLITINPTIVRDASLANRGHAAFRHDI